MIVYKRIVILLGFLFAFTAYVLAHEIHDAAKKGDLEKVKTLLEKDPKLVNAEDKDGRTPLHWAARGVRFEVIKLLIEKGADVNAKDDNGVMPLHSVASRGHKDAVELFIAKGTNLNTIDNTGKTPLSYSVIRNPLGFKLSPRYKEVVNLLVAKGVEVNTKGEEGNELLHNAAYGGHRTLVELLIEKGADIKSKNSYDGTLLHSATAGGLHEVVEMLIEKGLKVDERNRYGLIPLHLAAFRGHKETVKLLLEKGADINAMSSEGKTPFHLATDCDQKEVVNLLIARGADQSPPQISVLKGEYLGQKKPGIEPELFTPGIISSILMEHSSPVFSSNGREVYWAQYDILNSFRLTIFYMKLENGQWTEPQIAPFSGKYMDCYPFFSPDGKKLFFDSHRPLEKKGEPEGAHIWVVEREGEGWSEPKPYEPSIIKSDGGISFSFTNDGMLYFTSDKEGSTVIYRSRLVNGKYTDPEKLGNWINTERWDGTPYVSPDGDYLLFSSGRPGGYGRHDLYICFREKDGSWSKPKNVGDKINSSALDAIPSVSPDGKFLFFVSNRNENYDVYWVDARIIEKLKPKDLK